MLLWDLRRVVRFVAWLALLGEGCAVRPIPEPPSVDTSRMSLTEAAPDSVVLTGSPGAIASGGAALRVANPESRDRSQVLVGPSGDFEVVLRGSRDHVLFLEILGPETDAFLVAVTGGPDVSVETVSPGPDQDGDLSPDAIDCAPNEAALGGSRCGAPACVTDSDCSSYQACVYGACVTNACSPTVEVCGNGVDEDCDGVADDGCTTGAACSAGQDCPAGQTCEGGFCTVCTATTEICGNGTDDDCDGMVDEGC